MNKAKALELLGGSVSSAAAAIGISPSAITQWPDELPPRIADRVYAAIARKAFPNLEENQPQTPATIAHAAINSIAVVETEPAPAGPTPQTATAAE